MVFLSNIDYIKLFQNISVGDTILWSLAFLFLGGLIHKGLEKYRKTRNKIDDKTGMIEDHEGKIQQLAATVELISGKIDTILTSIDTINNTYDEREARRLRREILKFSDNVRNGMEPSKDAFQDIFESNQEYESLITKNNIKNGFTAHEIKFIYGKYDELYGASND